MSRRTKVNVACNGRMNSTKAQWQAKYDRRELIATLKSTSVKVLVVGTMIWASVEYILWSCSM